MRVTLPTGDDRLLGAVLAKAQVVWCSLCLLYMILTQTQGYSLSGQVDCFRQVG